jgi:uncharacterized protein (TIGR00296 family)
MHPLINLAKSAVENFVKSGKIIEAAGLPEEFLKRNAGVFVTIEKKGDLRGCIGTYLPTRINIAEETIRNAAAAASEDDRFGKIEEEELPHLSYKVYVLSYPAPVKNLKELDPEKFGVIVKTGPLAFPNEKNVVFDGVLPYKTGLLLPGLETVRTVEEQIAIACQKGGIDPLKERIFIYKFTAEKYEQ